MPDNQIPEINDLFEVMQDDIGWLLRELGLGDQARPISPHAVIRDLVIPEIRKLKDFKHSVVVIQRELRLENYRQHGFIEKLLENGR